MVDNRLTDEKALVEKISVQTFWGIFNRSYRAEDGFSLEIFRGNTYLGSLLSRDITGNSRAQYQRMRLQNNDTILRVNLGYRSLDVACQQLPMRDGWTRSYEGTVSIVVSDPYLFALQYQQRNDPVALAKLAIEDAVKRYAQRTNHDDIREDTLRYEARLALSRGVHKNYGLTVVEVLASKLYLDPKRAEMRDIEQQGQVDRIRIVTDGGNNYEKELQDAEIQRLRGANTREEDVLQRQHNRNQAFLDAASDALMQKMIREIGEGVPPDLLVRRYPQFAQLLGASNAAGTLAASDRPLLNPVPQAANIASNVPHAITGKFSEIPASSQPTAPLGPVSGQPFYHERIGASLTYVSLTDKERQAWGVTYAKAFMVADLDAESVAEKGDLMRGDMIVEADEQPLSSVQPLLNALDSSPEGTALAIRILRGGQIYDLELELL